MKKIFCDKRTLKSCKIYNMLRAHAKKKHVSFHTPGHKAGDWDITELSYSDNLSCPKGVIAEAERDISALLHSSASFILTDGSTSGIFSMLKASKITSLALPRSAHKSVLNGCLILNIKPVFLEIPCSEGIPLQPCREEIEKKLKQAEALLLTSPDYYGNIAELVFLRELCDREKKLLLIDGAHGGHLRRQKELYAGAYADFWVDGVHKSLPALTQGAVVSARTLKQAEDLKEAVDIFRTTSPSYPIMASVEYAVKYRENPKLEREVLRFIRSNPSRIYFGGDWTKLCVRFGESSFLVEKYLEKKGVYAEFCDGNILMFYLSPATKIRDFSLLCKYLKDCFRLFPLSDSRKNPAGFSAPTSPVPPPRLSAPSFQTEWVELERAEGRICARACGLFPPCMPLLFPNEKIAAEKIRLLKTADNVFGLQDGKICVFAENPDKPID